MKAYGYNEYGVYTGTYDCQIDPVMTKKSGEPRYLVPAQATLVAPPDFDPDTGYAVWTGDHWTVEAIPEPPEQSEPQSVNNAPSDFDRLEAQIIYTAMMTDTLLEE